MAAPTRLFFPRPLNSIVYLNFVHCWLGCDLAISQNDPRTASDYRYGEVGEEDPYDLEEFDQDAYTNAMEGTFDD